MRNDFSILSLLASADLPAGQGLVDEDHADRAKTIQSTRCQCFCLFRRCLGIDSFQIHIAVFVFENRFCGRHHLGRDNARVHFNVLGYGGFIRRIG